MWSELGPLHKPYGCVVDVLVPPLTAGVGGATESLDYTLDPFPSNKVASIQPWYEGLFLVLMEFVMPGSVNIPGRPALCFVLFLFFWSWEGALRGGKVLKTGQDVMYAKILKQQKLFHTQKHMHAHTNANTHAHACTQTHTQNGLEVVCII